MHLLDLIITHHNEAWEDCRKMFEMLRLQRGVKEWEFNVIFVQDGDDRHIDMARVARVYPFVGTFLQIPQSGVSAARNAGLDAASAPWVMFCDCDDSFYALDSLWRVLESIREAGDRGDLLWSDFWVEMRGEKYARQKKGRNAVFNHGKVYRRNFLLENGIRFDEDLDYSEDAMFNSRVYIKADPKRIAKMPEPVYMWCYREESLSNYTGGEARRNISLFKKRVRLCEAYEGAGRHYDAICSAARAELDYYWELNGQAELPGHTREEWVKLIRRYIISRWPDAMNQISTNDRAELFQVSMDEAKLKKLYQEKSHNIVGWLKEIGAIGTERKETK